MGLHRLAATLRKCSRNDPLSRGFHSQHLAVAASLLGCAAQAATQRHWTMLEQMERYLRSTRHYGLKYSKGKPELTGQSDADFAGCAATRRSTRELLIFLGPCLVECQTRIIQTVVTSTFAAEYIAANRAAEKIMWIRRLLS